MFAEYQPRHLDYGQPHPDAVVETTSLSFAELPAITMHSHLPKSIQKPKTDDKQAMEEKQSLTCALNHHWTFQLSTLSSQ